MKTKLFGLLLIGTLLFAQTPMAVAQSSLHNWSAVQSIPVNDRLIIKQKNGDSIEGEMIEANATNLSVSRKGKVVNISRDDIRQIERSTGKAQKGKWAAIGGAAGAGVGLGIGAAQYSNCSSDCEIYLIAGSALGGGIGAVAGLLIGATRRSRELVYTAP